jgi:hypothetical protein
MLQHWPLAMTKNLNSILVALIGEEAIRSKPKLSSIIIKIKARAANDAERAYLLGLFFKYQFDSDNLPTELKKHLIEAIKVNNVSEEYYLRKTVGDKDMNFFAIVLLAVGIIFIMAGLLKLLSGEFWILQNLRYLQIIVDDGRYTILIGLLFTIPCLIAITRSQKMTKLIRNLQNPQ